MPKVSIIIPIFNTEKYLETSMGWQASANQ